MAPRARGKASKRKSEKGKLAGGDEHDDDEVASDDPQPSNLRSRKKRLRSILSPFENEELVDLLVQIGTKIPAAAAEIRDAANEDPQNRRLYVRFLNPTTTTETLCAAFSSFGEIEDGLVILNWNTGVSRCHGFITFKNLESAEEALENPPKMIDGYVIECNHAFDRWVRSSTSIWVSGLPPDASAETLRSYFSKYGEVEACEVKYERNTNTSKGHGFVTFKTIEGARQANREPQKFIGENRIYVWYSDLTSKEPKIQRIMQSESTASPPPQPPQPPPPPPPPPPPQPPQPPQPPRYEAYPYYGRYAIARPHHFGANDYPFYGPYAIAVPRHFGANVAHPYYGPYAIAGHHYVVGNEAYGMAPWGRSGYPYH